MFQHNQKDFDHNRHQTNVELDPKSSHNFDLFTSTLNELHLRIKKALKLCEPFSLLYKELEDILLVIETKENYFRKIHGGSYQNKYRELRDSTSTHSAAKINSTGKVHDDDDSFAEEDSVQHFRKQGRELINEYKSVLDEMKNRNQILKSLYQPPRAGVNLQPIASGILKPELLSPSNYPISPTNFPFSPSGQISSSVIQVPTANFKREVLPIIESQNSKQQTPSYSEVLHNIEKFMRNLDQRTEGQSKKIESITQEIDILKQQMQPYKHISEIRDIAEKLDEQRELLQEKFVRENVEKSTNITSVNEPSKKQQILQTKLHEKKFNPAEIAEQVQNKAVQLNEIHNNFDDCSRFLVRKRLEHNYAKENGQLSHNNFQPERLIENTRQTSEIHSKEKSSSPNKNLLKGSDFDVQAALLRRQLRMKNYLEREERLKRDVVEEKRVKEHLLPCAPQDLNMTQTLKLSANQNLFDESEAIEIRINSRSNFNASIRADEELASTRKSCLTRRGFNSKENSGSKGAAKRIRFADEEMERRALKFDELEVAKPLNDRDFNTQDALKDRSQKSHLKGEISQLDKEIKVISQLLNSAILSEKISSETKI